MITVGNKELFVGLVRGRPKFIFHFHKGWWWIRILRLQLEVMNKRLSPFIRR